VQRGSSEGPRTRQEVREAEEHFKTSIGARNSLRVDSKIVSRTGRGKQGLRSDSDDRGSLETRVARLLRR